MNGVGGLCLCLFDMMIDTLEMCSYGIGGLLRRGSRDMIFLFGDKACSEDGGDRTTCHLSCSSQRMWKESAYLRPSFATGMTIAAWPADIRHDGYRRFGDWA